MTKKTRSRASRRTGGNTKVHAGRSDAAAARAAREDAESLHRGIADHRAGRLEAAKAAYETILGRSPDHPDALHFLGLLHYQSGDAGQAIALMSRAIEVSPGYAAALNNLGNVLRMESRMDEAVEMYRRCLHITPKSVETLNNLGVALKTLGRLEEALENLKRATEIDPQYPEAHHNLGNLLSKLNRPEEAVEAYRKAVGIRPYHGPSRERLGAILAGLGRIDEAANVYREWLEREPNDELAKHMLAGCSLTDAPSRASDEVVRRLFDSFSDSFDRVLERLQYQAPAHVEHAIVEALGAAPADALSVLDAGCGTGLCGPALRRYARRLVGVDLSPAMVEKARERHLYDDLVVAELTEHLRASPEAYDLIASADTLCYFGDLRDICLALAAALRPSGLLVFTVEATMPADDPRGSRLGPSGRYAHAEAHLREQLRAAGFEVGALAAVQLRVEMLRPVGGWVITARKAAAGAEGSAAGAAGAA